MSNNGKVFPINRANDIVQQITREITDSNEFSQILKKYNFPYAISTLTFGFTRTERSKQSRTIALIANRLFSIPLVFFTFKYIKNSYKYDSTTYFLLIDAGKQKIAMYNAKEKEIDLILEIPLRSQILEGLYEYWTREKKNVIFREN